MPFDPDRHHRRSIRWKGYDYTLAGLYFVTICIEGRMPLLGNIIDGQMVLHPAGEMVQRVWDEIPAHYPGVGVDAFVVMPNHIHGIIVLTPNGGRANGQAQGPAPTATTERRGGPPWPPTSPCSSTSGQAQGPAPTEVLSLADVVARFKSFTMTLYGRGVRGQGWPPYPGRLWQRNYYERVIRNERELDALRDYIVNNPAQWAADRDNPMRPPPEG